MATIRAAAVISAVYALHERHGDWPTAEAIADYLEVNVRLVLPHLHGLKDERIFRDRRRRGKRAWMPWGES